LFAWARRVCIILKAVGEIMNPGYLSYVVLLTLGILFWSGWKDYFLKGFSNKLIAFFMAGWLMSSFITLRLYFVDRDIKLNLVFIFLLVFSVYLIALMKSTLERLNIVTISLLLGLLDFIFREVLDLTIGNIAILISFAAVCLQKKPLKQINCLLLGFLCSNVLSLFTLQRSHSFVLADQSYQDLWWVVLLLSRVFTVLYEHLLRSFKKLYFGFFEKK
jgi:hypothetical protein